MKNKEWLEVEHILRYLLSDKELTQKDYYKIDFLKSAIIALFGFKVFEDDNEIFYFNMNKQAQECIDYLQERYPTISHSLENVREFINNNL
jgi:hypothetical protein